jgi:hypothetical protein
MAGVVENVPAEARWTIAAQSLTGAATVSAKALLDVLGQERFNVAWAQIWGGLGKAAKQVADGLGLAGDDAKSVAETNVAVTVVAMGPEVKIEAVEATAERTVLRNTECPYWNRMKELGISDDLCSAADPAYFNGLANSLNPKVTVTLTKAMPLGDPYCEWVYELQK